MSSQRGPNNWYDLRRNNRRALKSRARKKLKYGNRSTDDENIPFLDPSSCDESLGRGIVAGLAPPRYSILSNDQLIFGHAIAPGQAQLLRRLAVGDQVIFDNDPPVVKGILRRRSWLARLRLDATRLSLAGAEEHVLAANVDLAVIVASSVCPSFHPRLVDRYLIMCQYGNIEPLLCITKINLAPAPDVSVYERIGLSVVRVSNKTRDGLELLFGKLEKKCCVLTGHSGVGKSSLINTLLNNELIPVSGVNQKSGKGRHTTVSSSLHIISGSTYLIDTPGIRSLGLWNIDPAELRHYFTEFKQFESACQYRDCTHTNEPNCAVRLAVGNGTISRERYESYVRLMRSGSM